MREAPVILGIAGGSGSGKTYLARRIQQAAGPEQVAVLSMDQYFCSLTDAERQLDPRDINFDHPSHIDFQRLAEDEQALDDDHPRGLDGDAVRGLDLGAKVVAGGEDPLAGA